MLILLSPAKSLDMEAAPVLDGSGAPKPTSPRHAETTGKLAAALARKTAPQLGALMSISPKLAELNRDRYRAFGEQTKKPALLAFAGDVYRGFDAGTMDAAGLAAAQDRVRILSGLYGVLRPLDEIEPYRLEMGTKLKLGRTADLYGVWQRDVAATLAADLSGHDDPTLVNLASSEYFKAAAQADAPVVTPVFREEKDGQSRILALFAKAARGMMARWAVDQRADRAEALKDFRGGGYRFRPAASTDTQWVFTRPQPPKKT